MSKEICKKLSGRKVLIVEDSAPVAMDIEDMLAEQGCIVVGPASTVAEALALVSSGNIEAAVLDINLHDERVFPVAKKLETAGVPFIFLSGYNPDDVLPKDLSKYRCLRKPLAEESFLLEVAKLL